MSVLNYEKANISFLDFILLDTPLRGGGGGCVRRYRSYRKHAGTFTSMLPSMYKAHSCCNFISIDILYN